MKTEPLFKKYGAAKRAVQLNQDSYVTLLVANLIPFAQ